MLVWLNITLSNNVYAEDEISEQLPMLMGHSIVELMVYDVLVMNIYR